MKLFLIHILTYTISNYTVHLLQLMTLEDACRVIGFKIGFSGWAWNKKYVNKAMKFN